MVKEIRVNATKIEFEDDELGATRTLKQLSDGTYSTGVLRSKVITATRDLAAVSGDVQYAGVEFTPTSIMVIATMSTAVPVCWGFADSSKAGKAAIKYFDGNYATAAFLLDVGTASGQSQIAVVKSYDADGKFTLTWTKTGSPTGTVTMIFLCFR